MTSFPIHVREKKVCLPAGHGPTEPATFNAYGRKKKTLVLLSYSSSNLQLPPLWHINHPLHVPIYTSSSLSSPQVPLCSAEEERERGGKAVRAQRKGRIAAFQQRGRRWSDHSVMKRG